MPFLSLCNPLIKRVKVSLSAGLSVGASVEAGVGWAQKKTMVLATERSLPALERISPSADKLAGFLVALVGGAFLVAPMVELTYVRTQKWQIVSVVLWVLVFSLAVAMTSKAKNVELLGATAAYAAVLVVFIGQSQS